MDEKVWIVGYNWIFVLSLIMTGEVKAACTPTPDCASIGYTETSCETDYLACPFDSTKLKCMPCDSTYRYSCVGENTTKGIGDTCNGKYASCECVEGAIFKNGSCVCDISCKTIGNIVYSDRSCSSCIYSDRTAVAVVVHSDAIQTLILSLNISRMNWSSSHVDILTLDNISDAELAILDMNGSDNTKNIIEFMPTDNETNNSAWFCYNMSVEGFESSVNKWYLPAAGEIYNYYYKNYDKISDTISKLKLGYSFSADFRSSTERSGYSAWYVHSSKGTMSTHYNKLNAERASCLLSI